MPIIARRPGAARLGIPPSVPWAAGATRTAKAADDKDRAAAAFHPKTLAIYAPRLSFNARRATDLLLHPDFTVAVGSAIFAVVVVRFALESLLREADSRKHKHGKRQGNVPKHGAGFHELLLSK
jgi:hypothetical protein